MIPGRLVDHLEAKRPEGHEVDWADDLDADAANRLHADLHARHGAGSGLHYHAWSGIIADPQPPMRSDA